MKYKVICRYGIYSVYVTTHHGKTNIANINGRATRYHIISIRGICGTSAPHYKVQHDTLESACDEAFNMWDTHGRIWIGE